MSGIWIDNLLVNTVIISKDLKGKAATFLRIPAIANIIMLQSAVSACQNRDTCQANRREKETLRSKYCNL